MNIFSFSRPSALLLHYGTFLSLCHLCAVVLFSSTLPVLSATVYKIVVFPMLEHSLMSLSLIFVGVLGLEYVLRDIDKER